LDCKIARLWDRFGFQSKGATPKEQGRGPEGISSLCNVGQTKIKNADVRHDSDDANFKF
jgi:hypothetical protein